MKTSTWEAIRAEVGSFVCEEGEDLAELLFSVLPAKDQEEWAAALEEHRDRVERMRAALSVASTEMAATSG